MLMKTPAESLPPSLESLAIVLRDPSLWPEGFQWNFAYSSTCAMGLAMYVWGEEAGEEVVFRQHRQDYHDIFLAKQVERKWGCLPVGYNRDCVQPEDVANRIDRVLERMK
jgi:hypothetical protein